MLFLQEKMFFLNYLLANLKSEQKFKGKTNKVLKQLWKRSSYFFVFKKIAKVKYLFMQDVHYFLIPRSFFF